MFCLLERFWHKNSSILDFNSDRLYLGITPRVAKARSVAAIVIAAAAETRIDPADVGSTEGHNAQSVNVVSDAGLPRLAMQARFCDTTAFGRQATEGDRAGGKCNDTRAHETGPEEESTSQGRR